MHGAAKHAHGAYGADSLCIIHLFVYLRKFLWATVKALIKSVYIFLSAGKHVHGAAKHAHGAYGADISCIMHLVVHLHKWM